MDISEVKQALSKKGYAVEHFKTRKEATDYLAQTLENRTIGFGGSVTLDEMGLYEKLSQTNTVLWHWRVSESETGADIIAKARNAEIYITSVNAMSESGEIVNIDGTGNRVSAMIHGHKKVYFILSTDKITHDCDSAISRARNIAAPLNAKRLNKSTPCAVTGKCYNCKSPDRICRILSVLCEKPTGCDYEVILIDEKSGY